MEAIIPEREEPRHPIAVVAERTGVSPDLLRAWERRYNAVHPSRSAGGQRLYSDADVERLRLMHATTRGGRSISQVASLSNEALATLAEEDAAARGRVAIEEHAPQSAELIASAMERMRALDADGLSEILRRGLMFAGANGFVEEIAAPFMRQIGEEWHGGKVTVGQEHLATAVVHDLLIETMRSIGPQPGAQRIVVATPAGEPHVVGAAMAALACTMNGWNVIYLGASVPAKDIAGSAIAAVASAIAVSLVYVPERGRILGELRTLRDELPSDIAVIAGGAGAKWLEPVLRVVGIQVVDRVADLGKQLATL